MPRDVRPLTLRTADGVDLAADVWLAPEPPTTAVVLVHGFAAHRRHPSVTAVASELRAAELMTLYAAWKYDQGTDTDADIAMAKVKASEMLAMVADEAIQIHGGMGLAKALPLERWYRELRTRRIGEGPSEVHRMVIARDLLGQA